MGFDYDVPMLDAEFVNLEQGTGIVHCAPSHGPDDFNLCFKNNIVQKYTVDDAGYYTDEIKHFKKIHIFKADPIVIEKLKDAGNLLSSDKLFIATLILGDLKAPLFTGLHHNGSYLCKLII